MSRRITTIFDGAFRGEVRPWVYAVLRVGLSAVLLLRQSDVLRPVVFLEHHRFVHGLDFSWSGQVPPVLESPVGFGVALGETATAWLVVARTGLAVLLLLGVGSRVVAPLLAGVAFVVFASDRFHYFHHLHVLYMAVAWLSLCPADDAWSLGRLLRGKAGRTRTSPIWPLQFVRLFTASVYLASGTAKLTPAWWSGSTLLALQDIGVVHGGAWDAAFRLIGASGVARSTCLAELAVPLLLFIRPTRRGAVALALALHLAIGSSMEVFTFGVEMAVLLSAFLAERIPQTHTA